MIRLKTILFLLRIHEKLFHPNFDDLFRKLYKDVAGDEVVIFDIGAHRGESIRSFKELFPQAIIHAFEPDVANFDKLYAAWSGAHGVVLNNFGIGKTSGEREFYTHLLSTTSTFKEINPDSRWVKLKGKLLNVTPEKLVNGSYQVEVKRLDDYVASHGIDRVSIMKFDTEGFEYECLQGCGRLLEEQKVDIVQVEGSYGNVYLNGTPFDALVELISEYDYSCYKQKRRFMSRDLIDAIFVREGFL